MERPKIIVVDASVVVKWFVEEEFTEQALSLVGDYERRSIDLRSTQMMPFEVMNALRYNVELGQTELENAGDALMRFRVALYPLLGDLKTVCLKLAYLYGLTVYDASYLALGELLSSDVYTADRKFIEKTKKGEGVLRHIGEYSSSA